MFEQLGRHLVAGPLLWSTLGRPARRPRRPTGRARRRGARRRRRRSTSRSSSSTPSDADVAARAPRRRRRSSSTGTTWPRPTSSSRSTRSRRSGGSTSCPTGAGSRAPTRPDRMRAAARVLTAAMLLGVSDGALDVARDYALEREQFGEPIGSFQAMKHMIADMFVRTGLARSATYAAAAVLDDPGGRPRRAGRSARQAPRRRGGDRERPRRGPGARRDGVHLGDAPAPPAEAGLGARALLRHLDGPRPRDQLVGGRPEGESTDDRGDIARRADRRPPTTCCASFSTGPTAKNSLDPGRGAVDGRGARGRRRRRLGSGRPAHVERRRTSAPAPTSSPATRCGRRARRTPVGSIQRRTALQAHRLIEVITTIQVPGGLRGPWLGGGPRVPAGAGRRLHDRLRHRTVLGAVLPTRVHPRQRRHLVPAPARGRGQGQGAAHAGPRAQRNGGGGVGPDPPLRRPTTTSTRQSAALVADLAQPRHDRARV